MQCKPFETERFYIDVKYIIDWYVIYLEIKQVLIKRVLNY